MGLAPLHKAADNNSSDVAELLIRSGADADAVDRVSNTIVFKYQIYAFSALIL